MPGEDVTLQWLRRASVESVLEIVRGKNRSQHGRLTIPLVLAQSKSVVWQCVPVCGSVARVLLSRAEAVISEKKSVSKEFSVQVCSCLDMNHGGPGVMAFSGKWRLLRCLILLSFIAVCCLTIYIPSLTRVTPKQVPGWELNVTRDLARYVSTSNDTTLISGKEICEDPTTYLVIIVTSAPGNFEVRAAIRDTWAAHNISRIRVGFLVGLPANGSVQSQLEDESLSHRDLIQDNIVDSYNNLTLKSVVLLKWFLRQCPNSVYLMKSDDDTYVDVRKLSVRLTRFPLRSVLRGILICRAKPIGDAQSKWFSPKYLYQNQFYPNYLSGTAYIMSRDVAAKLYDAALVTPIFYLEDVYITGLCAQKAGVRPRNMEGLTYSRMELKCHPNLITSHRVKADEFRIMWEQRENCTALVTKPTIPPKWKRLRNSCY